MVHSPGLTELVMLSNVYMTTIRGKVSEFSIYVFFSISNGIERFRVLNIHHFNPQLRSGHNLLVQQNLKRHRCNLLFLYPPL